MGTTPVLSTVMTQQTRELHVLPILFQGEPPACGKRLLVCGLKGANKGISRQQETCDVFHSKHRVSEPIDR